jgi:hypothetical protein
MRSAIPAIILLVATIFLSVEAATRIEGRRLLVNDRGTTNFSPYFVSGVCYYPIPIGFCTHFLIYVISLCACVLEIWSRREKFQSGGLWLFGPTNKKN